VLRPEREKGVDRARIRRYMPSVRRRSSGPAASAPAPRYVPRRSRRPGGG
jgi:hypothetical protein